MSDNIPSATLGAFERELVERNRVLIDRYEKAGWLSSENAPALKNDIELYQMAQMLENTKRVLATEAAQTTSVFGTSYVPAMMGMIRQIFPRLIGKEIASIQPLDRPTGKVFKLDMLRDDDSDPTEFGSWSSYQEYARHSAGEAQEIQKGMKLAITDSDISIDAPQKLNVEASLELMQDLRAYHNLDAMELLRGAAVDEIAREIDGILVNLVRDAAIAHHTVTFGTQPPTGYTAENWPKRLQRAILQANNEIYKAKDREATFLVVGARAALELEDLSNYRPSGTFSNDRLSYGLEPVGTLGRFSVLRSRYVTDNEIIVGRKGSSILDAGAFWLPYVPLFVSDRVFDVRRQKYDQSFMSRSGTHVAGNEYFARVVIDDGAQGIS